MRSLTSLHESRVHGPQNQCKTTFATKSAKSGSSDDSKRDREVMKLGSDAPEASDRPMQRELDALVRKLDREIDLRWEEEMRLGKPVYDHLIACVRAKTLTRHQLTNA